MPVRKATALTGFLRAQAKSNITFFADAPKPTVLRDVLISSQPTRVDEQIAVTSARAVAYRKNGRCLGVLFLFWNASFFERN